MEVVFTISPVRHVKDGFIENQRSKSRLIEAVHQVCDHSGSHYFPSYEIVMDELRDYRFYDRDMVHLNEVGIEVVWSRFRESVINKSTFQTMMAVEKFRKLQSHRPKNPELHKIKVLDAKKSLLEKYPTIQLE